MKKKKTGIWEGKKRLSSVRKMALLLAFVMLAESIPFPEVQAKAAIVTDWEEYSSELGMVQAAAYGGGCWLTVIETGDIYRSADGLEWEWACSLDPERYSIYEARLKWAGDAFYLYGVPSMFLRSDDGAEWTEISVGESRISDVVWENGVYYAATGSSKYDSGTYVMEEPAQLYTSGDGENWEKLCEHADTQGETFLAAGGGRLVATDYVDTRLYTYSPDGELLSVFDLPKGTYVSSDKVAVGYVGESFAAVLNGRLYSSADGEEWKLVNPSGDLYPRQHQAMFPAGNSLYFLRESSSGLYQIEASAPGCLTFNYFAPGESEEAYAMAADEESIVAFGISHILKRSLVGDHQPEGSGQTVLTKDQSVTGDYELKGTYDLAGHTFTVDGDVTGSGAEIRTEGGRLVITGDCTLGGNTVIAGEVEIQGSLLLQGTCLVCEGAQIHVGGDVKVSGEEYNYGIEMKQETDEITIAGNLVYDTDYACAKTAGCISVAGNVTLGDGYRAGEAHRLVLCGSARQQLRTGVQTRIGTLVFSNGSREGIVIDDAGRRDRSDICEKIEYAKDAGAPTAPSGLRVIRRTGDSVYLSWNAAADDTIVKGYHIYKDGKLIEESCTDTSYQDTEAGTQESVYYVTAYDPFSNESERSNEVSASVSIPVFTAVTPEEGAVLGQSVRLYVQISGLSDAREGYVDAFLVDSQSGSRKEITTTHRMDEGKNGAYLYIPWDLSEFKAEQDITVEFVVTDYSGYQIKKTVQYHIDRTPPDIPVSLAANDQDKKVALTWNESSSEQNVAYYHIYRRKYGESEFTWLTRTAGWVFSYTDASVEESVRYEYALKAEDSRGNVSDFSKIASVYVRQDTQSPVIESLTCGKKRQNGTVTATFTGSDNRAVTAYELYLVKQETDSTQKKDTEDSDKQEKPEGVLVGSYRGPESGSWSGKSGSCSFDSAAYPDGAYVLTVYALDAEGNRSVGKSQELIVDNSGPEKPTITAGTVSCTSAALAWSESAEEDFAEYRLEEQKDGVWQTLLHTKTERSYFVTGLLPDHTYQYRIYAVDDLGNESERSDILTVTTPEDEEAPGRVPAASLQRQTGSRISFSWKPSADNVAVAGYRIYRDGELVAQTGADERSFSDTGLESEKRYAYELTAFDEAGNESVRSAAQMFTTQLPIISRFTPEDGSAIGTNQTKLTYVLPNETVRGKHRVVLGFYNPASQSWEELYAKEQPAFVSGNGGKSDTILWDTSALREDQEVRLRLTVTDEDGNVTEKEYTYHLDRTPPRIPVDFGGSEKDAKITLTWSGSADKDCALYRIYKKELLEYIDENSVSGNTLIEQSKQGYELLTELKAGSRETFTYVDADVLQLHQYAYYIETSDAFGNMAQSQSVLLFVASDVTPPAPPTDVSVRTRTGSSITIAWGGATDNVGVAGYNVYRNGKKIAENIAQRLYQDRGEDLEEGLLVNVPYIYTVTALDLSGNESQTSPRTEGALAMPKITGIQPEDHSVVGQKQITLQVEFADVGNSKGNTAQFQWYDTASGQWVTICEEPLAQQGNGAGSLKAVCRWTPPQLPGDEDEEIDVRAIVTDADGNAGSQTVTYTIDRTAPMPPALLTATEQQGVIVLEWTPGSSSDIEGYYLYRREVGAAEYIRIAQIKERMSSWYQDGSVQTGAVYEYKISAYDMFGREGEMSENTEALTVSEDTQAPKIVHMNPLS
ncbi:MAG: fibronectin type III domain-containing protein, partial [Lachnospiraceae bacterium]|nr:fibronectin type III domain-containing protein [Lachnospiraceae bacterium]